MMALSDRLSAYVGLPWRERGRTRAGIDCWGLVRLVYVEQLGIVLPDGSDRYTTAADAAENARVIAGGMADWIPLKDGDQRPGDVLLFERHGEHCHLGVLVRPGWVLHIRDGIDSCQVPFERPEREGYRRVGYFRHRARRIP